MRPYLSAHYVHDFLNQPVSFAAGFVGTTAVAPFALAAADNDWAEISGGLSYDLGSRAAVAIEADTTVLRSDLSSQTYRGELTLRF